MFVFFVGRRCLCWSICQSFFCLSRCVLLLSDAKYAYGVCRSRRIGMRGCHFICSPKLSKGGSNNWTNRGANLALELRSNGWIWSRRKSIVKSGLDCWLAQLPASNSPLFLVVYPNTVNIFVYRIVPQFVDFSCLVVLTHHKVSRFNCDIRCSLCVRSDIRF